jgi:hypothetical protein
MAETPAAVRTYEITVRGFGPSLYCGRTPAKARAACFRDYQSYDDSVSFRAFLAMSSIRKVANPDTVRRILVCGKPATQVIGSGIKFMYDGSDVIMTCHPSEVQESTNG